MAKAKESQAFLVDPEQFAVAQSEESPADAALDDILDEIEDDTQTSHVSVWKVIPRDPTNPKGASRDQFLMKRSAIDFQDYGLEGIQTDYGEGRYRVMVFGISAEGKKGLLRSRVVSVGPMDPFRKREIERQRMIEERQALALPAPAAAPSNDINSGLVRLADAMMQGFQSLQATMMQQKASRSEILSELAQVKTLFAPPASQSPAAGVENQLGLLSGIVSLAKELGGGASKETTGLDLLKELISEFGAPLGEVAKHAVVATMRAQQQPQQPLPMPQAPQTFALPNVPAAPAASEPAGNPLTGVGSQPVNGAENVNMVEIILKQYLPRYVSHAAHNNDPITYANEILDTVPEHILTEMVNRPDVLDWLATLHPGVNQFRPWFAQLLHIVREELTRPDDENINEPIDGNSSTTQ